MKRGIIVSVLAVVLGVGSAADARHLGRANSISGTVTAISKKTITVSVLSSGSTKTYTVRYTTGTKVIGPAAHGIDSSLIGHSVSVVGSGSGSTIKARQIVVAG